MNKKKQLPAWYKLFIEKRIKKLEIALTFIDVAENCLECGLLHTAIKYRDEAIKRAK
jgi:hypothetical protein